MFRSGLARCRIARRCGLKEMLMQSPAPLTVLGLVALATTAIVCGDTAGKLLTGAGVQPLFVAWCRVALIRVILNLCVTV